MTPDLEDIDKKLTIVCLQVNNLMEIVTEMKVDRERHQNQFWEKMNNMVQAINAEERERIKQGHALDTEIKVTKTKLGMVTISISTIITLALNWVARKIFP